MIEHTFFGVFGPFWTQKHVSFLRMPLLPQKWPSLKHANKTVGKDPKEMPLDPADYKKLFFAPEELRSKYKTNVKFINEKMDIWKIPDITVHILSTHIDSLSINDKRKLIFVLDSVRVAIKSKNVDNYQQFF